jgi:hypothetical protein
VKVESMKQSLKVYKGAKIIKPCNLADSHGDDLPRVFKSFLAVTREVSHSWRQLEQIQPDGARGTREPTKNVNYPGD